MLTVYQQPYAGKQSAWTLLHMRGLILEAPDCMVPLSMQGEITLL